MLGFAMISMMKADTMKINLKDSSGTRIHKKYLPKVLRELNESLQRKKIPVHAIFLIIGLLSTLWFLIRVIPKPSRATYPCMQAAAPFMSGFIVYLLGIFAAVFAFKTSKKYFADAKYLTASTLLIAGMTIAIFSFSSDSLPVYANSTHIVIDSVFTPIDSANSPVGTARGIFPGRVVWMWDPSATKWNGTSNYWWSETNTIQTVVDSMLSKSVRGLTGKSTDVAAWDTLFKYFNQQHGKGSIGYQAGEKIAIKLSLVQSTSTGSSNNNFSTPQLVLALTRQLVNNAGVIDSNITFYDIMRTIPASVTDKCRKEFPRVHFVGSVIARNQEKYIRDTTSVHFSQNLVLEHPTGGLRTGYLPTIVTHASYIINFANLKGHRYVGVTGCAKNHFGSMCCVPDNTLDPNTPHAVGVHPYITVHDIFIDSSYTEWNFLGRPMGSYNILVDLMGNKDLGGKTLLFLTDGLYVVPKENDPNTSAIKFQQPPFNNRWTSSIFLSQDEVALESVTIDFLRTEQAINNKFIQTYEWDNYSVHNVIFGNVDNYLHEAAQANNPPSGTFYTPNKDGIRLSSLGVHEHWNNPTDKQYTRNLGTGNGIELFTPESVSTSVNEMIMPSGFVLNQNYPNPFNPATTISYALPVRSNVTLKIYDALGREVSVLINEEKPAGEHQVIFDAKNLASGVYFYRLQVNQLSRGQSSTFTETKKLVLLR
jgi:hypothetical protein